MKDSKILIIGGSGFIGRNLSAALTDKGALVYSFDKVMPEEKDDRVQYIIGDFFDDDNLDDVLEDKDVVIHAVSTINPGNSNKRYMQGYSRDFVQSVKLCARIIRNQQRMLFLSSGGTVYGNQEIQPITEECSPLPINHYGNVKLCIENAIRTFNTQLHTKMRIARISNPYGPGQDYTQGVGFVEAALKRAMNHEPVEIWGDGENIRDYVYIEDVCAMLCCLLEYEGEEEVFNISSGEGVSQKMVLEALKSVGLNAEVKYLDRRSVDLPKTILDNRKIKSIYDGKIRSFQEGFRAYYHYLDSKTGGRNDY